MDATGAQQGHPGANATPAPVMRDDSRDSQPMAQPAQTAVSVPPPSPLEPPARPNELRARTQPAMSGTPPSLPATSSPAPQQAPQPPRNSSGGFASPEGPRDFAQADQYGSLAKLIKSSDPAIVRQVLRDHWGQCLVGSEYHTAFALNAILHQASPATLNRAVLDFGQKLVSTSKAQILEHFQPQDFDDLADVILTRVSPKFLDRALAQRVETIDAKSLVNTLARAERLGFSVEDILEEHPASNGTRKTEQVIPSLKGLPLHQLQQPAPQQHESPPMTHASTGLVQCGACKRPCSGTDALYYHSKKAACDPGFKYDRVGHSICPHCGCTFGSTGGVGYHLKSEVCGTYSKETLAAVHKALQSYAQSQAQRSQEKWAQPHETATPTPAPAKFEQSSHTPSRAPQLSPHPPSSATQGPRDDPYKHLSPETLERFRQDMARAEEIYGQKLRDAMLLPEPESTDKLSRHKNAYNAKISTTRKRYGIRLRERRSKEEVDAERIRLLQRPNAPELWLEQERKARELEKSGKRTFDTPHGPGSSAPATAGTSTQPSQSQQAGHAPVESPRKRVPLSEMGGLSGSAGSAEVVDPTAHQAPSSQSRGFAQMQQQQPPAQMGRLAQGTRGDPMAIDSNSDTVRGRGASDSGTESSDDDSDEDIPARA